MKTFLYAFLLLFALVIIPTTTFADDDDDDEEVVDSTTVQPSRLEMPNAFSPNGDGINDRYQAKTNYQNITEFRAIIFNRYGQKLFEWTDWMDENGGWDGTYNGRPVKDGVYFVRVRAKGGDGKEYDIRRDVNIIRGYNQVTETANEQ